ncbi:MAG: trypsin-like peptidase domain-containing protein [Candidatus Bathyarchaeota archaeon]|nr:trypsin-like peptidase domain-containing protein [Candidatus Bathyarchaeota archaeon]
MSAHDEKEVLDGIEKATKGVVNISTVRRAQNLFYQTATPASGMGSGTIYDDKEGLILTNNHVVGGADKINVTFYNNQVAQGTIVGSCVARDIAVIQVKDKNLPPTKLGDSDKLRVGQRVFAIGNPFGLTGSPTVTSGVISALNRTIQSKRGLIENLVQTDAAINPGNSGGPLIDLEGKIVAINTAIIPYAQGIGFAVPINAAKTCTTDILTQETGKRPWLGIVGLTLTPEIARYYGFPVGHGVLVSKVAARSPAGYAGITQGDIILEVDNRETHGVEDLAEEIRKRKVGEQVRVFALRNSKEHFFELKLKGMP